MKLQTFSLMFLAISLVWILTPLLYGQGGGGFIFDDFDYHTIYDTNGDDSGEIHHNNFHRFDPSDRFIFGENKWQTSTTTYINARGWRRFNFDDNQTSGNYERIYPGKLTIKTDNPIYFWKDYGLQKKNTLPGIVGNFSLGDGTYVAHVRLSSIPILSNSDYDRTWMMSAFWGMDSSRLLFDYDDTNKDDQDDDGYHREFRDEVDFEWNSWEINGLQGTNWMSVGNIDGYRTDSNGRTTYSTGGEGLNCGAWNGSDNYIMPNCAPLNGALPLDGSGVAEDLDLTVADDPADTRGRWIYLVYTVEQGEQTSFYLYSPDSHLSYWGGHSVGGGLPTWERALVRSEYAPIRDISPIFSFHWHAKNYNNVEDISVNSPMYMDINYFLYDTKLWIDNQGNIDLDGIRNKVTDIRNTYSGSATHGLRVNTTGYEFHEDERAYRRTIDETKPFFRWDPGINILKGGYDYTLTLDPPHLGTTIAVQHFQYRTLSCGGSWSPWPTSIDSTQLDVSPPLNDYQNGYSMIEIRADLFSTSTHYSVLENGSFDIKKQIKQYHVAHSCPSSSSSKAAPGSPSLSIYPNPSQGDLAHISISAPSSSRVDIEIIDMLGRLVAQHDYGQQPAGDSVLDIDLNHLPAGVYTCRVTVGEDIVLTDLLTVQ